MKSTASKTTTDSQTATKPFFNKGGDGLFFQREAVQEQPFFTKSAIQANLSVGAPNDPYEQEAEKVSRQVMSSYDQVAGIQRKLAPFGVQPSLIQPMGIGSRISRRPLSVQTMCPECEQEQKLAQPKSMGIQFAGDGAMVPADIESKIQSRRGGGSAMDVQTRSAMETSFGADFSGVKVHTDSTAVQMSQQLNAHAFTVGNDIFFNKGRYQPQTKEGAGLLSHELTHTVQQGASVQNKRISKNSLLNSFAGHEAAHLSAMSGGVSALNKQEIAQLQELPEEEMTKMQQLQMLQMKGVDEVQKKEGVGTLRRCNGKKSNPCTITSTTKATSPSNRSRTKIGVGEEVDLSVAPSPATWSITSGGGKLTPNRGVQTNVRFTADDNPGVVTLSAVSSAGNCMKKIEVIEPSSWTMKRDTSQGRRHKLNRPDIGWKGIMYFHPNDVNFYNIETRELDSAYVGTGSYSGYTGVSHGNYPPPDRASGWFPIQSHTDADGSTDNVPDTVDTGDPGAAITGASPPFNIGSGYFPITLQWRVGTGTAKNFPITNQEDEIFANGKCESRKGSHTERVMWNDPAETY